MKKQYFFLVLLFAFSKGNAQKPLQNFVSNSFSLVSEEWVPIQFESKIYVTYKEGILTITSFEFLNDFSGKKLKLADKIGLNSSEFTTTKMLKKSEKDGITSLMYEGKFVLNTLDGAKDVPARVTYSVGQSENILGINILNQTNSKEYILTMQH